MRIGSGYLGSDSLKTSTANEEVIPSPPSSWTTGYKLYKFSFMNSDDCTVIINNKTKVFLRANQGFTMNEADSPIYSFKIVEPGVNYNWIGAY